MTKQTIEEKEKEITEPVGDPLQMVALSLHLQDYKALIREEVIEECTREIFNHLKKNTVGSSTEKMVNFILNAEFKDVLTALKDK